LFDTLTVTFRGGDGGNGRVSFRKEKHVPRGGPDGGNGGKGGDVVLIASDEIFDFSELSEQRCIQAGRGSDGL